MKSINVFKTGCYVITTLLLLSSCDSLFEKPYDIDIADHQSLIAATALISPLDSIPRLFVSQTTQITENTPYGALENASVSLFKDETLYDVFVFDSIQKYYLGSKRFNEQEGDFRFEVSAPDLPLLMASQQMPNPVRELETSLNVGGGPLSSTGHVTDELLVSFVDDPNVENYYEINIFPLKTYNPLENDEQYQPETINSNLIKLDGGSFIFSDGGQNGQPIVLSFYDFFYSVVHSLEIRVYLSSITKDKYLYRKTFQKYNDNDGSLFSEPIIIHSNTVNGEGIFTVESMTSDTIRF